MFQVAPLQGLVLADSYISGFGGGIEIVEEGPKLAVCAGELQEVGKRKTFDETDSYGPRFQSLEQRWLLCVVCHPGSGLIVLSIRPVCRQLFINIDDSKGWKSQSFTHHYNKHLSHFT